MKKQRGGLSIYAHIEHRKSAKGRELAKLIALRYIELCYFTPANSDWTTRLWLVSSPFLEELSVLPVVQQIPDPIKMDRTELFCQFETKKSKPATTRMRDRR